MTDHIRKNFCFTDPVAENGDVFVECNLEQLVPDTVILASKTGLRFERCRLINCVLPLDAEVIGCRTSQVDRCTHLHPTRISRGQTPCEEECRHVVETIEIVGGPDVYLYKDLAV